MSERLLREWIRGLLVEAGNLSAPEMKNRAKRWGIFLQKMKSNTPFSDLQDNEFTIPVAGNDELVAALESQDPAAYKAAFQNGIITVPPNAITSPNKLKKTPEFGGLAPGGRLQKEQGQIAQIQSAIDAIAPVDISVGRKIAPCGVGIENVSGTPKADAILVDTSGQTVAAISLKDADVPTQMQQWGGIGNYTDHPEISAFIEDLKKVQAASPSGRIEVAYFRDLKDVKLARKLCYGDKSSVENDCDMIIASQAPIQIDASGQIIATNIFYAPKVPPGEWRPTLWATFRTGRGTGLGLKDIRIGCYPKAWGATRSNEPLPKGKGRATKKTRRRR